MRLLATTALSLAAVCLVAGILPADAKTRRHRPAASAPAKPTPVPVVAPSPAETGFNVDGTVHAPVIEDAPTDDYQRVAWCHGVLSGDMDLAQQIDSIMPVDQTLMTIGRSYLRSYEAALTLSGKGETEAGHKDAEDARQRGYDGWKGARASDVQKAASAYLTWQLPGDCEHAAVRLSGHPNLFAEMATDEEVATIDKVMKSGGEHGYDELPKPVLTAQTVSPEDADAPIATNTLAKRANQAKALPPVPPVSQTQPVTTGGDKPKT
ncbi:MAG: hypothetical protein JF615_07970 [Asticcacaulis sp.]|nr:hypothetical protein [Asticcacaulis sp.]